MSVGLPCECPVEGCAYRTEFRLNELSGETYVAVHAARRVQLRAEHPRHPDSSEGLLWRPIQVGDAFPLAVDDVGDCPADRCGPDGLMSFCCLDTGHVGGHIATNGRAIVEIWQD